MKPSVVSPSPSHADQCSVPYTLVQVDPPTNSTANPTTPRLAVTWSDVSLSVPLKDPATGQRVFQPILRGVSGEALPGELLVIMGPSGAGKSTLLDCIANRNAVATGTIHINGHAWTSALTKRACYVLQDDLFYATLTVHEHLTLQAQLRMGAAHVTPSERTQRVADILSELGLTTVAHSPIGDVHVKGLSGGQRKRLALATELLTNPSILFVDEPTSGLDSVMAETVVKQLRSLARTGRTVVATMHQPSSTVFALFDKLYLLADGRTVFHGDATQSVAYFASQGLECPMFMNPTDFFMQQLVAFDDDADAAPRVQRLGDAWASSMETHCRQVTVPVVLGEASLVDEPLATASVSTATHIRVLCRRNLLRLVRDVVAFRARLASTLVMAVVSGLVFFQLSVSQTGIQDFTGVLFFLAVNQFVFSANPEFISVPLEVPLVLREHNGGLYHVLSWYVAKNVSELPFQLVYPLVFLVPAYFLIGFQADDATLFFTFYLVISLVASAATGMGYMVACAATRVDLAPTIGVLLLLPCLLFGGLFLNGDSTPVYFVWLEQISPIKYGFHGLMRAFWTQVPTIACPASSVVPCRATSGLSVLAANGIRSDRLWADCVMLVTVNVSFRVMGALLLWRRARRRSL